jgi:hypothetical protein
LVEQGVPSFAMQTELPLKELAWGSKNFKKRVWSPGPSAL